jgi:exodeoxyribonuclease V alpha subunit
MCDIGETTETEKITFTVAYVLFSATDSDYKIIKAKNVKTENIHNVPQYIVKGHIPNANEGDVFKADFRWVNDAKRGWQIEVFCPIKYIPKNINAIKSFLKKNVKGLGKSTINNLVDLYGTETIEVIKNNPEELLHVKGLGKKRAIAIQKAIKECEELEKLTTFLFKNGFNDYTLITKIYENLGSDSLEKIKGNPYCLCDILALNRFKLIDTLAINMNVSPLSEQRISKLIQFYIKYKCFSRGDTYIYENDLLKEICPLLNRLKINTAGITTDLLCKNLTNLTENKILIRTGEKLYLSYFFDAEYESAKIITMLNEIEPENTPNYEKFFKKYEKETGITFNEDQKEAVRGAYENGVFILTGNAGTGKTLTVNAIIDFFTAQNEDIKIQLCAPTGRASKRMSELCRRDAFTIHKMLGLRAESNFKEIEPLDADLVICDEASMIDIFLFKALLSSLKENKVRLILVGDKDQLPPVGAGMPFKDLLESEKIATVRLSKLFRQGINSQINVNATHVLRGINEGERFVCNPKKQDFFVFNGTSESESLETLLKTIECLKVKGGEKTDDIVVLSPMKKGLLGVENINSKLQEYLNPYSLEKKEVKIMGKTLRVGDRVLQTMNNYDLEVYNGDIGKIEEITEETIYIKYESKDFKGDVTTEIKEYNYRQAEDLMLAYAMTIHKSQGSEFPCVIMPSTKNFINMSKALNYTAITRAKKRFIIVGDIEHFYRTSNKLEATTRNTSLGEMLN